MTCVAQDLAQMGEKASEILMRRIHGDDLDFPKTAIIDVHFRPRKSVRDLTKSRNFHRHIPTHKNRALLPPAIWHKL